MTTIWDPNTGSTQLLDGVVIGSVTPAAGTFTALAATTLMTAKGTVLATSATPSPTTGLIPTSISMTEMRTAAGLMMTAAASGTNWGLVYTPGTGTYLTGTPTSSSTTTDVAAFDIVLPPNYIAGSNITLTVYGYFTTGSGTIGAHTMAAAAYLNAPGTGLQGSTLIATSAITTTITTPTAMVFTITGTTLLPGSLLTVTISSSVANSTGVSTQFVTAVSYT